MNKKWLISIGIIAVIFAVGFGLLSKLSPSSSPHLIDVSGSNIQSTIQKSSRPLVLVNLWASWCEPCKLEFPALLELRKKYPQMELVLISLDNEEQRPDALDFLKDQGVDFPSFFKGDKDLRHFAQIFPLWQGAIPASFLANPKMEILDSWFGETTASEFEAKIKAHLPKP